ncbi:alpha/beta fold hydrolase [Streptomyces hygroscopicus]|uniref:alpha/beta fold hydrolase n=1 Tax=Streptomyces hygroscopicus TaxID=1912 RepID=UPI00223EA86B|nr:alpha/beta hydrolase [Streptomyces hygroscopicus]
MRDATDQTHGTARRDPAGDRQQPILLRRRTCRPPTAADGPRILLLHGLANSGTVWDTLCDHAARHDGLRSAELWTADLPWRASGLPQWNHRTDAATWAGRALEAARDAGGADIVVAHSYAATAVLSWLCREAGPHTDARSEDGIRGLVLVSPFFRDRPADIGWDLVANLAEDLTDAMEEGIRAVAGERGRPALRRAMAERVTESIGPYGWYRFLELYMSTPWLRTDALHVPTLVVSGTADAIADPAEGHALVERLGSASWRPIDGGGHFPMVEQPERLARTLAEFTARVGAGPRTASGGPGPRSLPPSTSERKQ